MCAAGCGLIGTSRSTPARIEPGLDRCPFLVCSSGAGQPRRPRGPVPQVAPQPISENWPPGLADVAPPGRPIALADGRSAGRPPHRAARSARSGGGPSGPLAPQRRALRGRQPPRRPLSGRPSPFPDGESRTLGRPPARCGTARTEAAADVRERFRVASASARLQKARTRGARPGVTTGLPRTGCGASRPGVAGDACTECPPASGRAWWSP